MSTRLKSSTSREPSPGANWLHRMVRQFRDGILDGEDPESWCFMVSAPLEGYMRATGIPCRLVEGRVHECCHFWIELPDGKIIDATASQFRRPNGRAMPRVLIGKRPAWYLPNGRLTGGGAAHE